MLTSLIKVKFHFVTSLAGATRCDGVSLDHLASVVR